MANDLVKLIYAEFERIRTEGIGIYNVAAAVIVAFVYLPNHLGVGDVPSLGQLARLQAAFLQKRAHSAVEVNYIVFDKFTNVHLVTSCPRVMPTNAVTDLDGDISKASPRATPILLGQSSVEKIIF